MVSSDALPTLREPTLVPENAPLQTVFLLTAESIVGWAPPVSAVAEDVSAPNEVSRSIFRHAPARIDVLSLMAWMVVGMVLLGTAICARTLFLIYFN